MVESKARDMVVDLTVAVLEEEAKVEKIKTSSVGTGVM